MGLTIAALVVAIFALQKTVIGEEVIRTVRYVPNPANLPSTKYGVLHSFKANIPDNETWNETTINNSDNTQLPSQYKQKNYGFTDVFKFWPKQYGSNTQYEPHGYSSNLNRYHQVEQTQDRIAENYESLNKEINNKGYELRIENSEIVTKGNQNNIKSEENHISQVNNKKHVSDIEILESQNYQENKAINLKSAGRKNCVKLNADEIQLKESENLLHLSDSISHELGSDILYEKITQLPTLHKTIHHNHAAIHNILLNLVPNIRTPVPVSKTATYSINYLYPINGYDIKNVGNNLFMYKTNNNEENYTVQHSQKDEEIGESDLDHLHDHSYGSFSDSMDTKFKCTTTNERETDVGRQTFNTGESLELVENVQLKKTGEDIYTNVLDIKEEDTGNTEKGLTSQITIKDDENLEMSQLKKESSSCQINKVQGTEDVGYIVDSHDNINEKLILHKNGVSSNAKEFGIQSTELNFYEDNTDYFTRDNLDVKEYNKYDYENAVGYRPYQNYKYFDTDFVPKDYSVIDFSNNNPFTHEADNEYVSNERTKPSEDRVISNHGADIKDNNYEYIPKHIAGITTYKYVDDDNKDQKYEYDVGKYDSIYSGTDKNEIISRYYSEILKQGPYYSLANDDEQDSGYGHYEYIQPNGEIYNNEHNNVRTSSNDNEGYKHYRQGEYITKDDSESPEYYSNAKKVIKIEGTEKLIENDQYTSNYNSEPSTYDHVHLVDYNYSPKIYANTEEPESGFAAHHQYDYISKTGAVYDGYDRNELRSKYNSKLIESDDISKYGLDSGNYRAYENIVEVKGDDYIVKDYKTPKYFAKDGEKYQGYEQYEYVVRDGSEPGVIDNNEQIFNNNQDIREFDKIYVSKYDGEFGEYKSIPKHYAPYEASDRNDYILKSKADVSQYESSEYGTVDELKYGNYEQYKYALKTNDEIKYKQYIDSLGIKEYESNLEESKAAYATQYSDDGSLIHDMQTNVDVTKEKTGKYFGKDVILENDWTEVDDSLKDKKVFYHNPSITAESEIRLPIDSAKHYIFNEPIYSETDSKHTSEIYVVPEAEKDIPYGYYVDKQDQYYENEHKYIKTENNLNDGLTYGTNSYLPLIYKSHKNGYTSYDSDFNSQAEVQDLLYSHKQYIPQEENSYEIIVDSHKQHVKDVDVHLRNWPVSIYKFDPEFFFTVNEEELTKLSDVVKANINEPYITSNFSYSETEEFEVESYGEKSITLESSDEKNQNYKITEFPSKLVLNDNKYIHPQPLNYHIKHDIKENYEGDGQTPCITSESLETPFLVDVNKEDEENDEYFGSETKCSHPNGHSVNGHLEFSLQHNSDKKSSCNCFKTELNDNLAVDNLDSKSYYETSRKPPIKSVGTRLSLNSLDSFKIEHPTIVLDSDPVPETKVNEYYSAEDLDEINSAEDIKCKQCYNRKSPFPKNHKVKQFSPIPTFPIKQNYEISSPFKQSKLKSSLHAPFTPNSRFIRSSEIVSAFPDSNISQRSLS